MQPGVGGGSASGPESRRALVDRGGSAPPARRLRSDPNGGVGLVGRYKHKSSQRVWLRAGSRLAVGVVNATPRRVGWRGSHLWQSIGELLRGVDEVGFVERYLEDSTQFGLASVGVNRCWARFVTPGVRFDLV